MLDCVFLGRKLLMEVSCLHSFVNQVENGSSTQRDQSGIRALTFFSPWNPCRAPGKLFHSFGKPQAPENLITL